MCMDACIIEMYTRLVFNRLQKSSSSSNILNVLVSTCRKSFATTTAAAVSFAVLAKFWSVNGNSNVQHNQALSITIERSSKRTSDWYEPHTATHNVSGINLMSFISSSISDHFAIILGPNTNNRKYGPSARMQSVSLQLCTIQQRQQQQ